MEIKVITTEEAIKMGLTRPSEGRKKGRGGINKEFVYGVVGKSSPGSAPGLRHKRENRKNIVEVFRMHRKTKKREILSETPEWKKMKQEMNINQKNILKP